MNTATKNDATANRLITRSPSRLESLDVLRGILAIGVMVYHYSLPRFSAVIPSGMQTVLHWVGIYGVEAFFVISGTSLSIAYGGADMRRASVLASFFARRFFRIAPLFYLALTGSLLLKCIGAMLLEDTSILSVSNIRVAFNVSFVFGAWDPAQSLVPAGWSVGMEMVFYTICPLLLIAFARNRNCMWCALAVGIAMAAYCDKYRLDSAQPLAGQWGSYVLVANHFVFFVAGMVVGAFDSRLRAIHRQSAILSILVIGCLCFIACAGTSDEIELVTGWRRALLGALTIGLCIGVCGLCPRNGMPTRIGLYLGNISYSVYLLHYFCGLFWDRLLGVNAPVAVFGASVSTTIMAASVCYNAIEIPFIRIGRRVSISLSELFSSERVSVSDEGVSGRSAA